MRNDITTREMIERLPKWAREHIDRLCHKANNAQAQLDRLVDSKTPSDIYISAYTNRQAMPDKYWLDASEVAFVVGREKEVHVGFDPEGGLRIYATKGRIIIKPHVSNVVSLEVEE